MTHCTKLGLPLRPFYLFIVSILVSFTLLISLTSLKLEVTFSILKINPFCDLDHSLNLCVVCGNVSSFKRWVSYGMFG